MFLNGFGQPIILNPQKNYAPCEEHNGPLLLSSAAFEEHAIPTNWCRRVIGSEENINQFKSTVSERSEQYTYYILRPKEFEVIEYENKKQFLTFIPAGLNDLGENVNIYCLKNDIVTVLIADNLSENLNWLPKAGVAFHRILSKGIDVLYIDDKCYLSENDRALSQREIVYCFVDLIRPKFLYGLRAVKLPQSLLNLCAPKYDTE